jgi:hypothetical protein
MLYLNYLITPFGYFSDFLISLFDLPFLLFRIEILQLVNY